MKRIIKFRAWNKPKKEMVNLREFGASQAEGSHIIFGCEEYGHQFYDSLNDADWELMQSTGLLDSEKVEVYEGDILQSTVDAVLFNWLVEWMDGGFVIVNIGVEGYLGDRYKISSQYYFTNRKVVGNLFENPELLKIAQNGSGV